MYVNKENSTAERFLKTFAKLTPTPSMEQVINKMCGLAVRVNKKSKAIECDIDFSEKISLILLYELEEAVKVAYEINSVVFLPTFENVDWEKFTLAEFVELIYKYHGSIVNGFFQGASKVYQIKNNTLEITLAQGHCSELLYNAKLDKACEKTIEHVFKKKVKVVFFGKANEDFVPDNTAEVKREAKEAYERFTALTEEQKYSNEEKSASLNSEEKAVELDEMNKIVKSGLMSFDISEPELVLGRPTRRPLASIREIALNEGASASFCGLIVSVMSRDTRDQKKVRYNFCVTDNDSSITMKFIVDKEKEKEIKALKAGTAIFVGGKTKYDRFEEEIVMEPASISIVKRLRRKDNAKETRVELHLHTKMSTMDGLCDSKEVISLAKEWNMPAVAVTDHGNVQSFPEIMEAAEKAGVKVIYGMEGYLVDDTARIIYNSEKVGGKNFLEDEFVIFDIETTGLSPLNSGITEIGAIRYRGGEVIDMFETYVDPLMPIPANITELTGITDEMVEGAPHPSEAVKSFLDFAGDDILVAHNANFDIGFIKKAAEDYDIAFNNPYLDTVALSRFVNPELSRHRLDSLRDYFKLGDFNHHRASDDSKMLAAIFEKMARKLYSDGITTIAEMEFSTENSCDPKKLRPYHITILVKSKEGLKNLYKLISKSYLDYFHRTPRIPKTLLSSHREGLIIGTACQAGELYNAVMEGKNNSDLKKIASFYDYFEIMPIDNNIFLVDQNRVGTDRESGIAELKRMNKVIYELGKSMKKLVVATGDVHYLEPEDSIYRTILQTSMRFIDADKESRFHMRTTAEMLEEFSYLGEKTAYEVVVSNTRKIADMVDDNIRPIPKGAFNPQIENSDILLREVCYKRAEELYGYKGEIPDLVIKRLEKELNAVISNGFSALYIAARELVAFSEENGYLVGSRGSVGSSIIAALADISEVNPLPPHRRCPKCKFTDFITDSSVGSGFDIDGDECPKCGTMRVCDGHDIPFETFLGFTGEKAPDIDLNFSGDIQAEAHKHTEVLFGADNVFRAGTISTIQGKTAYGFVKKYLEEEGIVLTKAEENRLSVGCQDVKRTTGQHPGGIVVVPQPYSIYDFTPIQRPADKTDIDIITTHFAFDKLQNTLQKLDILGHDVPTKYYVLKELTGIDVKNIPLNDKKVLSLFTSPEALGLTTEAAGVETGTLGIPECGTKYVRQMMIDAQPKTFSDLLQISGLSHGEGIWIGNGKDLIESNTCTISEIIGTRDSIMLYLINHGMESALAFKIMEDVRRGKGLTPEFIEAMKACDIPEWYIESCQKIKYMFPKAHAAAYMIGALRLAWYKVYEPLAFYACYFSVQPAGIDAGTVMQGRRYIIKSINELASKGTAATQREIEIQTALELVNEMYARGIEFLHVDLYKSHKTDFLIEDGNIRLPLNTISGLGNNAADKIYSCIHQDDVGSLEELKIRASLSQTVVDTLIQNNCLGDLPETEQMSLF